MRIGKVHHPNGWKIMNGTQRPSDDDYASGRLAGATNASFLFQSPPFSKPSMAILVSIFNISTCSS